MPRTYSRQPISWRSETLGRVQRNAPFTVCHLDIEAQSAYIEQAHIERSADARMKQEGIAAGHGILVITERSQAEIQKVLPELLGFGVGHRVIEAIQAAVVMGEA